MIIQFDTRDDDIEMITDALKYIPTDREDILGYLCYLKNVIGEQQEIRIREVYMVEDMGDNWVKLFSTYEEARKWIEENSDEYSFVTYNILKIIVY